MQLPSPFQQQWPKGNVIRENDVDPKACKTDPRLSAVLDALPRPPEGHGASQLTPRVTLPGPGVWGGRV